MDFQRIRATQNMLFRLVKSARPAQIHLWWPMKTSKTLTVFIVSISLGVIVLSPLAALGGTPFGRDIDAIVAAPESVEAWRTVGSLHSDTAVPNDYYKRSGKGILVSTNLAAALSKAILDSKTYPHFDGPIPGKDCFPEPGVAVRFTKGKRRIDFFVCFECNIVIMFDSPEKEPDLAQGAQADFDPGHNKLLQIVKRVFPKDRQIQALRNQED